MFISDDLLTIIKKYNTTDEKALIEFYSGLKYLSSGLDKYKINIAKLINEQNLSDEIDDTYINDLYGFLKTIKNYKKDIDNVICDLRENIKSSESLQNLQISDTTNTAGMVYLKVTTNDRDCPCCYKNEIVPLEDTQTRFKRFDENGNYLSKETIDTMHCKKCNKYFITRNLYYDLQNRFSLKNTNLDISLSYCLPKNIDFADFIVLSNIQNCSNISHHVKDIIASIKVVSSTGKIIVENINANYCQECDRFIILKDDYRKLHGIPICKVIDETKTISTNNNFNGFDYSDTDTLFFQRGYNVNCVDNLPKVQRQKILEQILIHKEKSKAEICSYIDTLISRGEKRYNWATAVSKWKEDREFISNYALSDLEEINVSSITKR